MRALGLDISTLVIGFSVIIDRQLIDVGVINLTKIKDIFIKLNYSADEIRCLVDKHKIESIFVEQRLMGFQVKRSSARTLMMLAQFNFGIQYICYTLGIVPKLINASHARKIVFGKSTAPKGVDTKKFFLEMVKTLFPYVKFPKTRNNTYKPIAFDMADAIVIGWTGVLEDSNV